jgi:AcrR family transcriptional regulator
MCPAPPKTSEDEIVREARAIVERDGPDGLSMQAVADAVGVRAPSLYKRFPHRDALLDAVVLGAIADLRTKLVAAARGVPTGRPALVAMARAYRTFAKRSPGLYALMFAARPEGPDVLPARSAAVAPVFAALELLVARDDQLPAARLLTSFLHGFVSMEVAGAFRLGGGVQQAFDFGVEALLSALDRSTREASDGPAVRAPDRGGS